MFKFLFKAKTNRNILPDGLFVFISLAALILLPIYFIILKSMLSPNNHANYALQKSTTKTSQIDTSDPYITKVPSLKDLIKGPIINGVDPSIGSEDAFVTIVEYSDFQCSYCRNQEKTINQILNEFKDKIRFIWKDYPENNINSSSFQAAIAARCADKQNKFWPYHDLLFENNTNLNKGVFIELAEKLNLNTKNFKKCLESEEAASFIYNNIKEANALDINGVPFIYINKQEIIGETNFEELKDIIEKEIKKIK